MPTPRRYIGYFKLMMEADTCHVLYVDAETADLVREWRGISSDGAQRLGRTHFVITTLSQLSESHSVLLNRIDTFIQNPTPGYRQRHCACAARWFCALL